MVDEKELQEMGQKNTICEAVLNVKDALKIAYPNSRFFIVATDYHLAADGKPYKHCIASKQGDQDLLINETCFQAMSAENKWLHDLITAAAFDLVANVPPERVRLKSAAVLHDAVLDYAKDVRMDIRGLEYCRNHPMWAARMADDKPREKFKKLQSDGTQIDSKEVHKIGQKVTPGYLEQHITQVREELRRLEAMRDKDTMSKAISSEIKRLKRKGENGAAKVLQDELDAFVAETERKRLIHEERMKNLAKAQAALEVWREKKRKPKYQQPNFAKMAKQKRQQIAARKAEKKKKKASGGGSETRSCSQLLNR